MSDKAERLAALAEDPSGDEARRTCCHALAAGLDRVGRVLWVGGSIIGSDRAVGRSPFGFGSDATVGVATLAQVAGQLVSPIVALVGEGNRYAAAALLRQLVEVEYLTWAFAEEDDDAAVWLRSSREERREFWSPARLRHRAQDRFPASDYWGHCDLGGHPTPDGMMLLPDHTQTVPGWALLFDCARHASSAWRNLIQAAERLGRRAVVAEEDSVVSSAIERWMQLDPLHGVDLGEIY